MIRRFALFVAFSALACTAPAAALADGTILVKFASTYGSGAKVAALGDDVTGTTVGGVKVVDPQPGESVADALARYQARPDVLYAEPNGVVHLLDLSGPDDTYYTDQWALPTISAVGGWSVFPGTFGAPVGTPIGIVDTGVDASHPAWLRVAASGRAASARLRHRAHRPVGPRHPSQIAADHEQTPVSRARLRITDHPGAGLSRRWVRQPDRLRLGRGQRDCLGR